MKYACKYDYDPDDLERLEKLAHKMKDTHVQSLIYAAKHQHDTYSIKELAGLLRAIRYAKAWD